MDLKQLKELITLLEKSKLHKLTIKEKNGFEVHLEKPPKDAPMPAPAPTFYHQAPIAHAEPAKKEAHFPTPIAKAAEEKPGDFITSPMVGTYYSAAAPEEPVFVKVGDRVDDNTVVCIIEAMKVMNEVKAGKSGVVREIMVDNANPVEFGTKIIRIE